MGTSRPRDERQAGREGDKGIDDQGTGREKKVVELDLCLKTIQSQHEQLQPKLHTSFSQSARRPKKQMEIDSRIYSGVV